MTKKVLDRKIGQDQSVPKDLVVRGRIRGNGAVHEHLAPTAKVDLQIAGIVSAKLHLSGPHVDASLAQNGSQSTQALPPSKPFSEDRTLRAFRCSNSS